MYQKIRLPEKFFVKHIGKELQMASERIREQITNLIHFVRDCHTLYYTFTKELIRMSDFYIAKVQKTTTDSTCLTVDMANTLSKLAAFVEQQTNRNLENLKVVRREREDTVTKLITERLIRFEAKVQKYCTLCKQLSTQEELYQKKAERFQGIEQDAVKYYSGPFYRRKFVKIADIGNNIQKTLDSMKTQHMQIEQIASEVKKFYIDIYTAEAEKVREMWILMRLIRSIIGQMAIPAYNGNTEVPHFPPLPNYNEPNLPEKCIRHINKIHEIFVKSDNCRQHLAVYLKQLNGLLRDHIQAIISLQESRHFLQMQQGRQIIQEYFSFGRVLPWYLETSNEVFIYCQRMRHLAVNLGFGRVVQEIIGLQRVNYTNFQRQYDGLTGVLAQCQRGQSMSQLMIDTYQQLSLLVARYAMQDQQFCYRLKNEVKTAFLQFGQLLKRFTPEKADQATKVLEADVISLFRHRPFDIFNDPFISGPHDFTFKHCLSLQKYIQFKKEAQNQEIMQRNAQDPYRSQQPNNLFNKVINVISHKQPFGKPIDSFNCALAYGLLLQGKMFIHKSILRFQSLLNRTTFFGKTELEIPRRDIIEVVQESAIQYFIVIKTKHGSLKFTSFLNNPLKLLQEVYLLGNIRVHPPQPFLQIPKTNQIDLVGLYTRVINRLRQLAFHHFPNDTYSKRIIHNQIVVDCIVSIEYTVSTFFMSFEYRLANSQRQRYYLKGVKNRTANNCIFSIDQEVISQKLLKPHFLAFVEDILGSETYSKMMGNTLKSSVKEVESVKINGKPPETPKSTIQNENIVTSAASISRSEGKIESLDKTTLASSSSRKSLEQTDDQRLSLKLYAGILAAIMIILFLTK